MPSLWIRHASMLWLICAVCMTKTGCLRQSSTTDRDGSASPDVSTNLRTDSSGLGIDGLLFPHSDGPGIGFGRKDLGSHHDAEKPQISLSDPLNAQTSALLCPNSASGSCGRFTAEGWQVTQRSDYLVWELPETIIGPGFAEIQVLNWNPALQSLEQDRLPEIIKSNFLALHGGRHGNQQISKCSLESYAMMRSGSNYSPHENGRMRMKHVASSHGHWESEYCSAEDHGFRTRVESQFNMGDAAWQWDPSHWYTFRIEWDERQIRFFVDGSETGCLAFGTNEACGSSLAPDEIESYPISFRYVFIGHDFSVAAKESLVGPIYRNLKVVGFR